jgi:hypothetical protein
VHYPVERHEFLMLVAGAEVELRQPGPVERSDAPAGGPLRGGPVAVGDAAGREVAGSGPADRPIEIVAQQKALSAGKDD